MRDNAKTQLIYKGQAVKNMDELREEARSDMCDHYCRYGVNADGLSDAEPCRMIDTVCDSCPLNYL